MQKTTCRLPIAVLMLLKVAKCWKFFCLYPLTNGSNFNLNGLGESRYLRWPLPIDNPPTPYTCSRLSEVRRKWIIPLLSWVKQILQKSLFLVAIIFCNTTLFGMEMIAKQGSRITSCGTCQFIVWWFLRLFSGVKPLTKPNCTLHSGMKWYLDRPIPFMIRIILFLQVVDVVRRKGL